LVRLGNAASEAAEAAPAAKAGGKVTEAQAWWLWVQINHLTSSCAAADTHCLGKTLFNDQ